MTASGKCHQCEKIATVFHYRRTLEEAGFHDGFWHCEDHGPVKTVLMEAGRQPGKASNDDLEKMMEGMDRRRRREFMRFYNKNKEKAMKSVLLDEAGKAKPLFRVVTVVCVFEQGSEDVRWLWDSATQGKIRNGVLVRGMADGDMIAANVELTNALKAAESKG